MKPTHFSAIATPLIAAALLTQVTPQAPDTRSDARKTLDTINKQLFTGGRGPALRNMVALKSLGAQKLTQSERESWLRLSRDAALRIGDKDWLESLKNIPDTFSSEMIYTVLLAYGKLAKSDIDGATATLDTLEPAFKKGEINVREERRIIALRARIAQLKGNRKAERGYIEDIIKHLPYWSSETCQSCHGGTEPSAQTSLPVTNLWFGERFVELMKLDGDAAAVKRSSELTLAKDPKDAFATLRLGYALKALGDDAGSERVLLSLPWAEAPTHALKKPRMMTTFP